MHRAIVLTLGICVAFGAWPSSGSVSDAGAATAAPSTFSPVYVAMGDSYSSGEGAPDFLAASPEAAAPCHQSTQAYPRQLAPALGATESGSFTFLACSGAVIANITTTGQHSGMLPQLQRVPRNASIVTLTVGGNDAGFGPILTACAALQDCLNGQVDTFAAKITGLRTQLTELYRSVIRRTRDGIGNHAEVLVLAYPQIFPVPDSRVTCLSTLLQLGYDGEEFLDFRYLTSLLNQTIHRAAQDAGVRFVDTEYAFDGHDICSDQPWANAVVANHTEYSFHPNVLGQQRLFSAVNEVASGIAPRELPTPVVGQPYRVQLESPGGSHEWTMKRVVGGQWLTLDPASGLLSGSPIRGHANVVISSRHLPSGPSYTRTYDFFAVDECRPGQPRSVEVQIEGQSIVVRWQAPDYEGSSGVQRYRVTVRSLQTGKTFRGEVAGAVTEYQVPGALLLPGQRYVASFKPTAPSV